MATAKNVEVMQVGTANKIPFELEDLHEIARAFAEQNLAGRLPVKLGHSDDDSAPAQGWLSALRVVGEKLIADIADIPDQLVEQIKQGRWRFVSMELLRNAERNGKKYKWMPDSLALLGAVRPAFDALKGLADVFASGVKGVTFEERFVFSRENESEADALRAQNVKLQQQLVHAEFERAVESGRILPRDREAFRQRFGDTGTAEAASSWIASTPKPAGFSSTQSRHEPQRQTFARADEELVARCNERIKLTRKEEGREISYLEASRLVMAEDSNLARAYVDMPSTLDR